MKTDGYEIIHTLTLNILLMRGSRGGGELFLAKIVSEYDQEIPKLQTADNPLAPRGRAAQPSRDTRKTN